MTRMAEALDCAAGAANNSLVNECSDSQGPRGPKFLRGSLKVNKTKTSVIVVLAAFMLPFVVAHGAGGRIEGKVTDPKGAVVIGAAITVTDPISNQTFAAITDNDGHYKVEGLPPGTYAVTVSAKGFTDERRDEVKIEEGATLNLDVKLELAPVEAAVNVVASGVKANADPVYQQLRQLGKNEKDFAGAYASVNNLVLNSPSNFHISCFALPTRLSQESKLPRTRRSARAVRRPRKRSNSGPLPKGEGVNEFLVNCCLKNFLNA